MRVLLTGAFGYLGGRLAELLDHEVILAARTRPEWAEERFGGRETRALDVLDDAQIASAVRDVDAVVHLASLDENEAARDPELAVRVSGEGTRRLLAAGRAAGMRRFIYLSTFHVYGPDAPAQLDERTPVRPAHPYGISRFTGEGFCYQHNRSESRAGRAVVLRMSNGYGAPVHAAVDRWSLAHNDFCRQAVEAGRIVLKTSGVQHRDMVWVGDVAQAISLVLSAEELPHDVFHVGGGHSISMLELAQRVQARAERKLERPIPIERPGAGPADAPRVGFEIARLRALGYQPHDAIDAETDRLIDLLVPARSRP